jgi:hypothetical protein
VRDAAIQLAAIRDVPGLVVLDASADLGILNHLDEVEAMLAEDWARSLAGVAIVTKDSSADEQIGEAGLRQGETMALQWGDGSPGRSPDYQAFLLAGSDRDAQERAGAEGSAQRPAQGGSEGHQAPEVRARALPSGRQAAHSGRLSRLL